MRNILFSTAVSTVVMLLGYWIAGWEISDPEAAAILIGTFASGLGLLLWLEGRNPTFPSSRSKR